MSGKMLVVFVKATGHVLAAATVASPPVVPPSAADLVGDALTLWSIPGVVLPNPWSLDLPADALGVAVTDPKPELLENPFGWKIGSDMAPVQLQRSALKPNITKPTATTIKLDTTPGFTGDDVAAVVFERAATGPVQVYPGATLGGMVTLTYTGGDAKAVMGFVADFSVNVALF